jgi:hypothetical protein
MFQSTSNLAYDDRSVGVVRNESDHVSAGYNLVCVSNETYLLDANGMVVHEWRSSRDVFCAKLRENGNLVRDGGETQFTPSFRTGGAAGYIEEVDWGGKLLWRHTFRPSDIFLTHHDIELMPNGNVLVLVWEKISKDCAMRAGRRPELVPQGEVWNNLVVELKPNGKGKVLESFLFEDMLFIVDFCISRYDFAQPLVLRRRCGCGVAVVAVGPYRSGL